MSKLLVIFAIFLLFTLHGTSLLDPDFGWHVQLGNHIQASGIPYKDPFSYSMPSYPFIDHEWLTNIVISRAYQLVAVYGLTMLFASIACFIFTAQLFLSRSNLFGISLVLLEAATFFGFFGIRPQVITWALFAFIVNIFLNKTWWKKLRFFLPILFLVWVNLHGGFAIGIFILFLYVLFSPEKKTNTVIFLLCLMSTFINPYGLRIWYEIFNSISDSYLRWHIQEWQPSIFVFDIPLWVFLTISTQLIFLQRKHFTKFELSAFVLLVLMGLSSIRHIPLLFLFSFPLTLQAISLFSSRLSKKQLTRFKKVEKIFCIASVCVALLQTSLFFYPFHSFFDYDRYYPKQAALYLHTHPPKGNILSLYEWGGYLIWKLPEKKVFIDGRMPSWRWKSPSAFESDYALIEYADAFDGKKSIKELEKKYSIDTILLPQKTFLNIRSKQQQEIINRIRSVIPFANQFLPKTSFDIHAAVLASGMKEVYSDSLSVIYQNERLVRQLAD